MKKSHIDRRTQYSKQMIRNALFLLLEEKELKSITVTDICKAADINRGTFYRYYQDIPDLFSQIESAFFDDIRTMLMDKDPFHLDLNGMKEILKEVLRTIEENHDFVKVMQKSSGESQGVREILLLCQNGIIESLSHSPRQISETEVSYAVEYALGGFVYLITKWINHDMDMPVEEINQLMSKLAYSTLGIL